MDDRHLPWSDPKHDVVKDLQDFLMDEANASPPTGMVMGSNAWTAAAGGDPLRDIQLFLDQRRAAQDREERQQRPPALPLPEQWQQTRHDSWLDQAQRGLPAAHRPGAAPPTGRGLDFTGRARGCGKRTEAGLARSR